MVSLQTDISPSYNIIEMSKGFFSNICIHPYLLIHQMSLVSATRRTTKQGKPAITMQHNELDPRGEADDV